jgi:hypothetical protein
LKSPHLAADGEHLFGTTWWRKHIASKPRLLSLAGFVRDVAEVRIADLDMSMDLSPAQCLDDDALSDALAPQLSLNGVELVGNQRQIPDDVKHSLVETHPIRRLGTTEDVARAALFLASAEAAWITGVVLDVAGGASDAEVISGDPRLGKAPVRWPLGPR